MPAGVTAIDVELWGGGSGSWASVPGMPGGGGSGGGYARKRMSGLTPGAIIPVTIGAGGAAGVSGASAPGAVVPVSLALAARLLQRVGRHLQSARHRDQHPALGNQGGVGSGGDLNLYGGDGGNAGQANQGGRRSTTAAWAAAVRCLAGWRAPAQPVVPGWFPGGGASGAGTGATGTTA